MHIHVHIQMHVHESLNRHRHIHTYIHADRHTPKAIYRYTYTDAHAKITYGCNKIVCIYIYMHAYIHTLKNCTHSTGNTFTYAALLTAQRTKHSTIVLSITATRKLI